MRIGRIVLGNWKNFAAADCRLRERSFLIGPNAAGKSNLLDAIRFLHDLAASRGGGLQAAVAARHGMAAIGWVAAPPDAAVTLTAELCAADTPCWRYEIAFAAGAGPGGGAELRRERVTRLGPDGAEVLLDRPDAEDAADPARLRQTALEQTAANRAFREVAEALGAVRFLHLMPQAMRGAARLLPDDDPLGGDLVARIAAEPKRRRDARLAAMTEVLRIVVPQFDCLTMTADARGRPHLRARYGHWPAGHPGQGEEAFSDGTLRLLGLIWALQEPGGPILIEEPEHSLNAAVAAQLPRLIRNATRARAGRPARQVLISTHSPDILSDPSLGLDEVLLVLPGPQGARLMPACDLPGAAERLAAGLPLAEILLPHARPAHPERLGEIGLG